MADRRRRRKISEDESGDECSQETQDSKPKERPSECESEGEQPEVDVDLSKHESAKEENQNAKDGEEETEEETDSEEETETEDDDDTEEYEDEDVIVEGVEEQEIDEERQSGDGQEQPDGESLDDDEDRKNPAYVPRKGAFFEHDMRMVEQAELDKRPKKQLWKDQSKWIHDRYSEDQQAPKSREELIAIYGYDIRAYDKPPDAPPRFNNPRGRKSERSRFGDFLPDNKQYHQVDYVQENNTRNRTEIGSTEENDSLKPQDCNSPSQRMDNNSECHTSPNYNKYDDNYGNAREQRYRGESQKQENIYNRDKGHNDREQRYNNQERYNNQDVRYNSHEKQYSQDSRYSQEMHYHNQDNRYNNKDTRYNSEYRYNNRDSRRVSGRRGANRSISDNGERRNYRELQNDKLRQYDQNQRNAPISQQQFTSTNYKNTDSQSDWRGISPDRIPSPKEGDNIIIASVNRHTPPKPTKHEEIEHARQETAKDNVHTLNIVISNAGEKKSYSKDRRKKFIGKTRVQEVPEDYDLIEEEIAKLRIEESKNRKQISPKQADTHSSNLPPRLQQEKANYGPPHISKSDIGHQGRSKRYSSQRQRNTPEANYTEQVPIDGPQFFNAGFPSPVYPPKTETVPRQEGPAPFQRPILQPPVHFPMPASPSAINSPPRVFAAAGINPSPPVPILPPQFIAPGMMYGTPAAPFQLRGQIPMQGFPPPPTPPQPQTQGPPLQPAGQQEVFGSAHAQTQEIFQVSQGQEAFQGGQPNELYRGGTTYYHPQLQHPPVLHRSPVRRAKAAIPIVNPQEFKTGRERILSPKEFQSGVVKQGLIDYEWRSESDYQNIPVGQSEVYYINQSDPQDSQRYQSEDPEYYSDTLQDQIETQTFINSEKDIYNSTIISESLNAETKCSDSITEDVNEIKKEIELVVKRDESHLKSDFSPTQKNEIDIQENRDIVKLEVNATYADSPSSELCEKIVTIKQESGLSEEIGENLVESVGTELGISSQENVDPQFHDTLIGSI